MGIGIFVHSSFADTHVTIPLGAANPSTPFSLSPSVLDVKTNETVIWQNNDVASHTVTTGTTSLGFDGRIDSGVISAGKTFSHKFAKTGAYGYYCLFHPWMTGVVNVGDGSKNQPTDTISFSTDKSSYHKGDSILISGKVSNFVPNEQVTLWITNLQGIAVSIIHVETESQNNFTTSIPAGGGLWESGKTYRMYAQYGSRSSIASTDIVFEPQNYTQKNNVPVIILAPLKQFKSGVTPNNVQCISGFVLVIKTEDGSPSCVKSATAAKLLVRGWAQTTTQTLTAPVTTTTQKGFLINIFAPSPTPALTSIVNSHLNQDDFVSSYRTVNMMIYPKLAKSLYTSSVQMTVNQIAVAKQNGIAYVCYDNEKDNAGLSSPASELAQPANYTNVVGKMVKDAGLKYNIQPEWESLQQEYKDVNWKQVDLLTMQLQRFPLGITPEQHFKDLAIAESTLARSENPNITILAQVNLAFDTSPNNQAALDFVNSLKDHIDGVSIVMADSTTTGPFLTALGR
jgi:plastocyanin